jgi:hypothetical protein
MAIDVMNTANQSTLKVITFTQDQFLKAYKTLASRVPSAMTPSWAQPGRDQSRDAIEKAFAFQAQLLESRKAFALGLLDAGAPKAADTDTDTDTTVTSKPKSTDK